VTRWCRFRPIGFQLFRLSVPHEPSHAPFSPLGRVREHTSPCLPPLRTELTPCQCTRLKPPTAPMERSAIHLPSPNLSRLYQRFHRSDDFDAIRRPSLYLSQRLGVLTVVLSWETCWRSATFRYRTKQNPYPPHYQRHSLPPASFTRWTLCFPYG